MEPNPSSDKTLYQFRLRRRTLLRWLAKRNVSQNDFARKCGLSSGFMSQLLSGERHAGPKTRRRILEAFPATEFEMIFEEIVVQRGRDRGATA